MNVEELRRLHGEYRQHIDAARDESASDEARATAQALALDARRSLDEAFIQAEQDRADDARMGAIEARADAQRTASGLIVPQTSPIPIDQLRAYGQSKKHGESLSFTVPISTPQGADWTTTDTTTYSSYTVPQTWADSVYMFRVATSGVLKAGPTMLNTANGNQINYPKLTTDMSSAAGAEGVAATETNVVFGTTPLNSYRVDGFTPISDELFRDTGVDLNQVLRDLAGRSLAVKAAPYYGDIDIGTGSSLPAAITVGITSGVTAASVDSVTLNEVRQLYASVLPGYRMNGSFICNSDIWVELMLKMDDNGNYQWQPSNIVGQPDTLLGKPIYEDAYFDASATGNIPMIFGDVKAAYIVRNIGGIEVSISRDFAFTSFESTVRWAMWHDAAQIDAIACKAITLA